MIRTLLVSAVVAAALTVSPSASARKPALSDQCWSVTTDSARIGPVHMRPSIRRAKLVGDIDLYDNPFVWNEPGDAVAHRETYMVCATTQKGARSVAYLNGIELPMSWVPYPSRWPINLYGSWKAMQEKSGMLQVSIDPESLEAQVIVLRGPYLKRVALVGTGTAVRVSRESVEVSKPAS